MEITEPIVAADSGRATLAMFNTRGPERLHSLLSRLLVKNPVHDFGHGARVVELTISRYSEADAPTVHRRLVLTIESAASLRHFVLINPEPLADLSGLMDAWAFRILDRNREGESSVEFGRYWLEYLDDDDSAPRHIQADRVEELREHETLA